MTGLQCPKALWLSKYKKHLAAPPDAKKLNVFRTGRRVGELAPEVAAVVTVELDRNLFRMAGELLGDAQNVRMLQLDVLKAMAAQPGELALGIVKPRVRQRVLDICARHSRDDRIDSVISHTSTSGGSPHSARTSRTWSLNR